MNRKMYIIIAVSLVFVLGLGIVFGASHGFKNWDTDEWFSSEDNTAITSDKTELSDIQEDRYVFEMQSTPEVYLSMGDAVVSLSGEVYTSRSLVATVVPGSSRDKTVDWSIAWGSNAPQHGSENVTNYVNVIPESNGSCSATVNCYQSFGNDQIVITVTTREGGYTATCLVTFVGYPTELAIEGSDIQSNASIGSYYVLGVGNDYDFDIIPSNIYNSVNADCEYTISVAGYGQIVTQEFALSHGSWNGTETTNIDIGSITQINCDNTDFFFDCETTGNTLSIHCNGALSSYYSGTHAGSDPRAGMFQDDTFKNYADDTWYFEITITETNSGITESIKVRPYVVATGVTLNASTISF